MGKERQRYILCISDDREYERLRAIAKADEGSKDAECVQALPTGYLTRDCELVCAFYEGDGNIKDAQGNQTARKPVFTDPVRASDHWTPGEKGRFGAVRLADFMTAVSKQTACKNAGVRHCNDELTLGYG